MINKILVAVERSLLNKSVFDTAISLAQTTGADLMLLHVLSPQESDHPTTLRRRVKASEASEASEAEGKRFLDLSG